MIDNNKDSVKVQMPLYDCGENIDRRDFLKLLGVGTTIALAADQPAVAGPFEAKDFEALVPSDKKLSPDWIRSLFQRGGRTIYRDRDLRFLGMPIGGICAGQVYLGGDGRLWLWKIFNKIENGTVARRGVSGTKPRPGRRCQLRRSPETDLSLRARVRRPHPGGRDASGARLDRSGWSDISFTGEYPIGFVTYRDAAAPVTVALEAFSPFIPLNADDSGLPATVLRYTVKNVSSTPVEVALAGWLENAVCRESATRRGEGLRHNGLVAGDDVHILECHVEVVAAPGQVHRPTIVFEDFESGTYNQWTVEGEAFGKRPAKVGEMFHHQPLRGARGRYLADSFRNEGSPNASAEKSNALRGS